MIDFPGFGFQIGEALSGILATVFTLLVLLVAVALIFLLVRFLLVATRAAQLYVAERDRGQGERPPVDNQAAQPAARPAARPARTEQSPQPAPPAGPEQTAPTRPIPPTKPVRKPPANS